MHFWYLYKTSEILEMNPGKHEESTHSIYSLLYSVALQGKILKLIIRVQVILRNIGWQSTSLSPVNKIKPRKATKEALLGFIKSKITCWNRKGFGKKSQVAHKKKSVHSMLCTPYLPSALINRLFLYSKTSDIITMNPSLDASKQFILKVSLAVKIFSATGTHPSALSS